MANSMWHIQQKGFGFHGTITDVVKDERGEFSFFDIARIIIANNIVKL